LFVAKQPTRIKLRAIFIYGIIGFCNDITLDRLGSHPEYNTLTYRFLYTFTVLEYLLFAYFLYASLQKKVARNLLAGISVAFVLFNVVHAFTSKVDTYEDTPIPLVIECIIILSFSIYYFFEQIRSPQSLFLYSISSFWIIVGFLLYLSGSFFLFLVSESLPLEERDRYWFINFIFNIIKNIFFSIAMIIKENKNPYPTFNDSIKFDDYPSFKP
jgi:hypothetical protein